MLYVLFDPFVAFSLLDFHDLQLLMGTGEFAFSDCGKPMSLPSVQASAFCQHYHKGNCNYGNQDAGDDVGREDLSEYHRAYKNRRDWLEYS